MLKPSKALTIFLIVVAGIVTVSVLVAVGFAFLFDVNRYKPQIETMISEATGMSVTIDGPVQWRLGAELRISLSNVRVRNRDAELAFVRDLELAVTLASAIKNEIVYSGVTAKGARISIQRDRAGIYNYERLPAATQATRPLNLKKVSFSELAVVYSDQQPDDRLEFSACDGELADILSPGGGRFVKQLSLNGQFTCASLSGPGVDKDRVVTDVKFKVVAKQGIFDIDPITVRAYGGEGTAKLRIDQSLDVPTLTVSAQLPKFRVEALLRPPSSGKSVRGLMNFSANLSMRGASRLAMRQSAQGEMSLSGMDLKLNGVDLDQQLQKFELSQNLSLLDVGSLLFVGPISLVVTKGFEFSGIAKTADTSTTIRNVISRWKVEKGLAHATDVALTTNENRVAVQGDLDFVRNNYQGIVVALIDKNGCAKARQKVTGSFSTPIADQSNILVPIGPLLKLLDSAKALFSGADDKCLPFYTGSLTAPK